MSDVLGIDLGTTNCCVATVGDDGRPIIIQNEQGARMIPSYVAVLPGGGHLVGRPAVQEAFINPASVIFGSKRLMGQSIDSPRVTSMMERVPYQIVAGPSREAGIQIGDEYWSPQAVATVLLEHLRDQAEKALGREMRQAVITVPAHFDNNQRMATLNAAKRAGLELLGLVNEPTAAALAFGWATKSDAKLAVYDLGGGTFDITVLEIKDGQYDVIATGGDTFLGGSDFDSRMAVHVVREHVVGETLKPLTPIDMLRLIHACERAKIELSANAETELKLTNFGELDELKAWFTRAQFEQMTQDLVTATIAVCNQTLASSGIKAFELGGVLLVGGQTRMPAIRSAVKAFFFREPNSAMNPDEAIAAGAALHAHHLISGEEASVVLKDVTPLTLGIDALHDTFSTVIPKHTNIPCSETRVFSTVADGQKSVEIVIRQGESDRASQNTRLGSFVLHDLTPGPRMEPRIEVTFRLDASGVLLVFARDRISGEAKQIQIEGFIQTE